MMQGRQHKRTSVDIQGKEVHAYLISDTPTHQLMLIPIDEGWDYFRMYERFIEGDQIVFRLMGGPFAVEEFAADCFTDKTASEKEIKSQHFRPK